MAKLALIYGMRLLPEEDLGEVKDATVVLKNGRSTRVTMHLIEGSKEEIEKTFHQSIEAFFEMYPEIQVKFSVLSCQESVREGTAGQLSASYLCGCWVRELRFRTDN